MSRSHAGTSAAVALALAASACGPPPIPDFPRLEVVPPDPAAVDEILFLIGDGGEVESNRSPILADVAERVERWSGAVARDSAVTVVFLGDNVYPEGIRDRSDPAFAGDSARLWGQIELVGGPDARRRATLGLFLAGNHDWGNMVGEAGVARLRNQSEQLETARASGIRVRLVPEAGTPGPEVIDLRHLTRLIALDTHWFLQESSMTARTDFFADVLEAASTAEGRHLILLAHHPYASAGRHGALVPVGEKLGLAFLLKKSGTLIQDLNSPKYSRLVRQLHAAFEAAERRPLIFAGGHDHSLQVLGGTGEFDPQYQLVSGSASKLSRIRSVPELKWGVSQPGYMMIFLLRDGGVELFVVASDEGGGPCPAEPEAERLSCMEAGSELFRLTYSERLTPPGPPEQVAPGVPDSLARDTLSSGANGGA